MQRATPPQHPRRRQTTKFKYGQKKRIISKAKFIEPADYDPSSEYTINPSDSKTIRLYRKLTKKRIDTETLYSQIYNQPTKNEKPKRTKHNNSTLDSRLTLTRNCTTQTPITFTPKNLRFLQSMQTALTTIIRE